MTRRARAIVGSGSCLVALCLMASLATAADRPYVLHVQLHPKLGVAECASLPTAEAVEGEDDFRELLRRGWVTLEKSNFDDDRTFYPCLQNVVVAFPDA